MRCMLCSPQKFQKVGQQTGLEDQTQARLDTMGKSSRQQSGAASEGPSENEEPLVLSGHFNYGDRSTNDTVWKHHLRRVSCLEHLWRSVWRLTQAWACRSTTSVVLLTGLKHLPEKDVYSQQALSLQLHRQVSVPLSVSQLVTQV